MNAPAGLRSIARGFSPWYLPACACTTSQTWAVAQRDKAVSTASTRLALHAPSSS
jgi:hypothetical protein